MFCKTLDKCNLPEPGILFCDLIYFIYSMGFSSFSGEYFLIALDLLKNNTAVCLVGTVTWGCVRSPSSHCGNE